MTERSSSSAYYIGQSPDETIKKSSQSGTVSTDSSGRWRAFRARDWQQGLGFAGAPQSQTSSLSSTPGLPHSELGKDCEVIVKIRDAAQREKIQ